METVQPKVHNLRHRRSESRHRRRHSGQQPPQKEQEEQQQQQEADAERKKSEEQQQQLEQQQQQMELQESQLTLNEVIDEPTASTTTVTAISFDEAPTDINIMSRTTSAGTTTSTISQSLTQHTILLVNGEPPPTEKSLATVSNDEKIEEPLAVIVIDTNKVTQISVEEIPPSSKVDNIDGAGAGAGNAVDDQLNEAQQAASSRNSSGDAQSLRETLQQLRPQQKKKGSSNSGGGVCNNLTGQLASDGTGRSHHHHQHHSHHHHRERERDRQRTRTRSPRETSASGVSAVSTATTTTGAAAATERSGILGFMERELRQCSPTPSTARSIGGASVGGGGGSRKVPSSLSDDPQASPAQRSIRSRSSLEKSPRRKRSKSESRRRRERKLIAAGEMEVRQANETLMRYLKQCSEMNDASLSGELEIDQSYDERRVHRKTKSQRDKRGHLISKLYSAGGGLSSLLRELSDDIVPAEGEEIYNPFTPVVSPTEDNAPAHIDKMFLQTSSGYRPVERCYYKHHHHHHMNNSNGGGSGGGVGAGVGVGNGCGAVNSNGAASSNGGYGFSNARGRHIIVGVGGGGGGSGGGALIGGNAGVGARGLHASDSFGDDVHCLLDADECNGHEIRTNIQLACMVQRIWRLVANICHGLLAGLALAHLLFVLSSPHPMDWAKVLLTQLNNLEIETTPTLSTTPSFSASSTEAAAAVVTTIPPTLPTKSSNTEYDGGGGIGVVNIGDRYNNNNNNNTKSIPNLLLATSAASHEIISDYATFAGIYLNTFYCLAILCLVSVLDRMDICRWNLSNATEFISFRWLIIAMIYIATIILTICSDTIDEKLYYNNNVNVTLTERELFSNSILNVWSSLSVTRSITAISGWIMIGLTPYNDMLYEHLIDLAKYQMTNN